MAPHPQGEQADSAELREPSVLRSEPREQYDPTPQLRDRPGGSHREDVPAVNSPPTGGRSAGKHRPTKTKLDPDLLRIRCRHSR